MRRIGLAVVLAFNLFLAWLIRLVVALTLSLILGPLVVEGQQAAKGLRIGYLSPLSTSADSAYTEAFREGLRELGYVEGKGVVVEARYADGKFERLPDLAAELIRLNVDVIVAAPTPAVRAAQQASRTVPIVMAFSGDPVGEGFVASLARPGGNITGLSAIVAEMAGKRVEFLKTILPGMSRVAFLFNPATVRQAIAGTEAAGQTLGIQVTTLSVRNTNEVDQAFAKARNAHANGLIVDLTVRDHWRQIVDLALEPASDCVRAARIRRRRRPHGLRTTLSRSVSSCCHLR